MNDLIHKLNECNSEIELYSICQTFIQQCGYDYFSVFKHPEEYHYNLYDVMLVSNWPVSLVKCYDDYELLKDSSFATQEKRNSKPTLWTTKEMYNAQDVQKEQTGKSLFINSQMSRGAGFSVDNKNDVHGFVLLTNDKDLKNESEFEQMQVFSSALFDKTLEIHSQIEKTKSKLSKREHECLLWTSEGKTSYEIGMILGLSENTINNYLVTVGRKLGAVNRPHMVGIALRKGYI